MGEIQSFGKWLRHRRRELDLTQDELARKVGCAPITIRKIEGDEMHPSKQLAESLSEPLGISKNQIEDFIRYARNQHPNNFENFEYSATQLATEPLTQGLEPSLPSGTVTFLFTDVEGSVKIAREQGARWESFRQRHHDILRSAIEAQKGYVFQVIGDAFCVAFRTATAGLKAAIEAQRNLQKEPWGASPIRVRMGIHTGEAQAHDKEYRGYLTLARVQRVMSVAHGGQILLSNASAELVPDGSIEGVSLRDMGEHRLKGLIDLEHLWQAVSGDIEQEFPALESLNTAPNNLPAQFTRFIGREREIDEITKLLNTSRLITLTGSGGTGKTRLAIEVAGRVLNKYPDGVWLIDFAALREPALVQQTIASALNLREEPNRPFVKILIDYLRSKNLLLVFDNCEHLLTACTEVANTLLQNCPNMRILTTSREGFGIPGENQYRIPSLSLPDPQADQSMDSLNKSEAVRVFLDRAVMVQPTFNLSNKNGSIICQICQRLDGIPLAIELAAARTKTLNVEEIGANLDDRFRLLKTGNRAALPRQQTLRATMEWSYNLLSAKESILFCRLSVFRAGWTLEAARSVCSDNKIEKQEVLELLSNLIDKSLVLTEERDGETRYRFLETIREYARERLAETGEEGSIRDQHLNYYDNLAGIAEEKFKGKVQLFWLNIMEGERDNLRSALDHALQMSEPDPALRMVGKAFWLWFFRGPWSEGQQWIEAALARSSVSHTIERARALMALGLLNYLQSDYPTARVRLHESLGLWKELGDPWWSAFTLAFIGQSMRGQDQKEASEFFNESLRLAKDTHENWIIAYALWNSGEHELRMKNFTGANQQLEESLQLSRSLEDRMLENEVLRALGGIAESKHEYSSAVSLYQESLRLVRELGDTTTISTLHYDLGRVLQLTGNNEEATRNFIEAAKWSHRLGKKAGMLRAITGLGVVAAARGQAKRAIKLLTASNQLFVKLGINYSSSTDFDQSAWAEGYLAAARKQSGEEQFEASRLEGEAMTLDEAIIYALNDENEDRSIS